MTAGNVPFGPQLIGQTEKALNAILGRLLAGSGVTEPGWVALTVTLAAEGALGDLVNRVAGALHVTSDEASARLTELVDLKLVAVVEGSQVQVTEEGRQFHGSVRAGVTELTARLWGDLPEEALAVAADVLNTVLSRAQLELAAA